MYIIDQTAISNIEWESEWEFLYQYIQLNYMILSKLQGFVYTAMLINASDTLTT